MKRSSLAQYVAVGLMAAAALTSAGAPQGIAQVLQAPQIPQPVATSGPNPFAGDAAKPPAVSMPGAPMPLPADIRSTAQIGNPAGVGPVPVTPAAPANIAAPPSAAQPVVPVTPATPVAGSPSKPIASEPPPPRPRAQERATPRSGSALDLVKRRLSIASTPSAAGKPDAPAAPTRAAPPASADDDEGVPPLSSSAQMLRDQAEGYNGARPRMYPMTPGMIKDFRKEYESQQDAAFKHERPRAIIDASSISLEPGAPATTIHLAPGVVSTIDFSDITGQPWPFTGFMVGNKDAVDVVRLSEDNMLLSLAPKMQAGSTNLTVALKPPGENQWVAPVSFTLVIDRYQAHYRHDVRIQALGPNGKKTPMAIDKTVGSKPGDEKLLRALAATDMPPGARPVPINFQDQRSGLDARGWMIDGQLYIRTRLTLASPGYSASLSSVDDMRIYRLAPVKAVIFSTEGRMVSARIGD